MPTEDWQAWHDRYDQPDSSLARRLRVVQERVRLALDACPPGPIRVVSVCAGQGRDLLGVRHREPPDLVPQICQWLRECGFEQGWLSDPDAGFGVGVHRFAGEPQPLDPGGERVFTFV